MTKKKSSKAGQTGSRSRSLNSVEYGVSTAQTHEIKTKDSPAGTAPLVKYRHVAAVHSKLRNACLSHDSETTPSFLGFRNLMVTVLSEQYGYQPKEGTSLLTNFLASCYELTPSRGEFYEGMATKSFYF